MATVQPGGTAPGFGESNEIVWAPADQAHTNTQQKREIILPLWLSNLKIFWVGWTDAAAGKLQVAQSLRQQGNRVPLLMLTARDATPDIVRGLDLGAGDYPTS